MIPQLPKQWLIHSIFYSAKTDVTDDYGNAVHVPPMQINYVRYDPSFEHTRSSLDNKVLSRGVIFIDAIHSAPLPPFVEDSIITFEGKQLVLKKVIPCYHPVKNVLRHYELEVV